MGRCDWPRRTLALTRYAIPAVGALGLLPERSYNVRKITDRGGAARNVIWSRTGKGDAEGGG